MGWKAREARNLGRYAFMASVGAGAFDAPIEQADSRKTQL